MAGSTRARSYKVRGIVHTRKIMDNSTLKKVKNVAIVEAPSWYSVGGNKMLEGNLQ